MAARKISTKAPLLIGGGCVYAAACYIGYSSISKNKANFDETSHLVENVRAFVEAVQKAKPAGAKGAYMKKIAISSTMGPGVSVNVDSANGN